MLVCWVVAPHFRLFYKEKQQLDRAQAISNIIFWDGPQKKKD